MARPLPYAAWLVASAGLLAIARAVDPYVFGAAAFAAAGISGILLAIALWFGVRPVLWALVSCVPTVLAFALLSTYRWA